MKKFTKVLMALLAAAALTMVGCKSNDTETFTVTFDANGGTGAPDAVTVTSGGTITAPTTEPTRDNYTFTAWYTDADATAAYDFSTAVTSDFTLYAGWTDKNAVKFMDKDGAVITADTVLFDKDTTYSVSAPTDPTADNLTFAGWYTESTFTNAVTFPVDVTASTTYYAKFTATVTFNTNGGSSVDSQTVVYKGTATKPTDPTLTEDTFSKWCSDSGLTTEFDFTSTITSNTTLYAKYLGYVVWLKSDSEALTAAANYGQVTLYNDATNPFAVTKGDLLIISTTVAFENIGQTYPSIGLTETGTSTATYLSIDGYYKADATISSYDYYFIYRIPSTGTIHYVSFNNGSTDGTTVTALTEGTTVTFTNLKIVQIPVAKISSIAQVIVDTDSTSLTASSGTYQYAPTISETTAAAGTKLFVLYTTDITLTGYKSHYLNSSFGWKATYPSGAAGAYSAAFDISSETTTNWLQIGIQNGSDAGTLTLSDVLVGIMPGISSF